MNKREELVRLSKVVARKGIFNLNVKEKELYYSDTKTMRPLVKMKIKKRRIKTIVRYILNMEYSALKSSLQDMYQNRNKDEVDKLIDTKVTKNTTRLVAYLVYTRKPLKGNLKRYYANNRTVVREMIGELLKKQSATNKRG